MTQQIKEQLEEVIKKNLPEKKEAGLYTTSKATGGDIINYNREDNDDKREGFNQALSQIDTSLIADEVLKIVVEKIHYLPRVHIGSTKNKVWYIKEEDLLLILSINKENTNNE